MKLTFLSAPQPLTKTYVFADDDSYDSTPYPREKFFTSHIETAHNLEELKDKVQEHGAQGHCLLKGHLIRDIQHESRAGLMASVQTSLLVLDFDGLDPQGRDIDDILYAINLGDVSYIVQYSASQGIKEGLNAHVFMILENSVPAEMLKSWLRWKNLSTPFLKDQIHLTKSGMAPHWPLDITLGQNDKLIYITPPQVIGRADPCPDRMSLVVKEKNTAVLETPPGGFEDKAKELVKQLRASAGLPDRSLDTKYSKKLNAEILPHPDRVAITGVKYSDEFVYLNLNGGDSWGYFHPANNPEVLYNFKGEPNYPLVELAPDYYREANQYLKSLKREAHAPKFNVDADVEKPKYWVINERKTGKVYKVTLRPEEGLSIDPAPTQKHVADFCSVHNIPVPDAIDDWDIVFNPSSSIRVDSEKKQINLHNPSTYQIHTKKRETHDVDGYLTVLDHALGNDPEALRRFINWLAFIWQTGRRPKTAWLMHGTFGTGKGTTGKILEKLFGDHYVGVTAENLMDMFNEHLARARVVFLDEISTDAWDSRKMKTKLKVLTDGVWSARGMRTAWENNTPLFFGLVAAANEFNPIEIELNDRRWNVAPRQELSAKEMDWFSPALIDEFEGVLFHPEQLQSFADFLTSQDVDTELVFTPMDNEAKLQVMQVTQNLQQDIATALFDGDAEFFVKFARSLSEVPNMEASEYHQVVEKMMSGGTVSLRAEEVRTIFRHIAGWNQAVGKFNKAMSHAGVTLKNVRDKSDTYYGAKFEFMVSATAKELWQQINRSSGLRAVKTGTDD